jgi:hypothetical protein
MSCALTFEAIKEEMNNTTMQEIRAIFIVKNITGRLDLEEENSEMIRNEMMVFRSELARGRVLLK